MYNIIVTANPGVIRNRIYMQHLTVVLGHAMVYSLQGCQMHFQQVLFFFQFVAIFAFATCTGFRGRIELEQNCNKTSIKAGADFKYPFQSPLNFMIRECKNGAPAGNVRSNSVPFDYRSSTEYFVVIGVFCFLYSFGILVYYIMFEPDQSTSSVPPSKFSPSVIVSSYFLCVIAVKQGWYCYLNEVESNIHIGSPLLYLKYNQGCKQSPLQKPLGSSLPFGQ